MFWRFGSDELSRPVAATVWLNDACTRPVRGADRVLRAHSRYVLTSFVSWRYSTTSFGHRRSSIVGVRVRASRAPRRPSTVRSCRVCTTLQARAPAAPGRARLNSAAASCFGESGLNACGRGVDDVARADRRFDRRALSRWRSSSSGSTRIPVELHLREDPARAASRHRVEERVGDRARSRAARAKHVVRAGARGRRPPRNRARRRSTATVVEATLLHAGADQLADRPSPYARERRAPVCRGL